MRSLLKYWMPLFIWFGVIFLGSTDLMSAEHTSRFLVPFLRWLKPNITAEAVVQIQFFVRKAAHLTEYAVLAILIWRALRHGTNLRAKRSVFFIAVWFVCAIFAVGDEFHQSFVAARKASPNDVLIDICGAIAGLITCMMLAARGRSGPLNQETRKPQKER
jgi:VanZ family protein